MHKLKKSRSLNQQILHLEKQIADKQITQQQQKLKMRELLLQRLTSWPMLLGALTIGLFLSQARQQDGIVAKSDLSTDTASDQAAVNSSSTCLQTPKPTSFWRTLLSLPLLTQGIWWLAEQMWNSRLFRDVIRQRLLRSDQRHPPY